MIPLNPTLTDTEVSVPSTEATSNPEWPAVLYSLRTRYPESRDLFSPREMAHLRFLRWLIHTGRLAPGGRPGTQQPIAQHNTGTST